MPPTKCNLCNAFLNSCTCRICEKHEKIHDGHLQCSLCVQDMLQTIHNAQQSHKKDRNARSKTRRNTRKAMFKLTQYTKFVDDARQ